MKIRKREQVVQYERTDGRTDRQIDRHDKANGRFTQFCERAEKVQEGTELL